MYFSNLNQQESPALDRSGGGGNGEQDISKLAFREESSREIAQSTEQQLENFISNLLRYGVLLSSAVVLFGGILYLIRHGAEPADYQFFHGEPSAFCSPWGVVQAVLSGNRLGIIQLGILLLIATPIARVIFSLLTFLWRRDFTYVIVTLSVLTALIYSLIGAYA